MQILCVIGKHVTCGPDKLYCSSPLHPEDECDLAQFIGTFHISAGMGAQMNELARFVYYVCPLLYSTCPSLYSLYFESLMF
jgi:hypothetical protein